MQRGGPVHCPVYKAPNRLCTGVHITDPTDVCCNSSHEYMARSTRSTAARDMNLLNAAVQYSGGVVGVHVCQVMGQ